jgi:magnesium-transporting ATPase (P-type)
MAKPDEAAEPVRNDPPWHAMSKEDVFKELEVGANIRKSGLTSAEAAKRLEKYGPNQLSEKRKVTLLEKIWHQLNNVLVGILLFVAVISVIRAFTPNENNPALNNWIQVGIIISVLVINTAIGIVQEGSAEKAAEALKAMLSSAAIVVRDGKETEVAGSDIVPGDVVILSLGDRVPADLRMIEVRNLACAEAALTGESVPIDKSVDRIECGDNPKQTPLGDRHNMCFSATLVSQGSGAGIIVATGDNTEIGTINTLVNKVEDKKTAVLEQIDTVSKILAFFILITAAITLTVSMKLDGQKFIDALSISLVCAVAMIPEGLEAIVTVVYAYAVSNMAKQNAIIRALPAVETLGSVTVICSDKTGTLTQNVMSLTAFVTSNARYKVDVNSTSRTNKNFVRDDLYMAERADHTKMMNKKEIIKGGPSVSRHDRSGGKSKNPNDFPYTMRNSVVDENFGSKHATDAGEVKKKVVSDNIPVAEGESPELSFFRHALAGGVLCSKCTLGEGGSRVGEIGNPTELSILRASFWAGVEVNAMKDEAPIVAEVPFSSDYKFMATIHESKEENDGVLASNGDLIVHVKGAPDRMIPLCKDQAKAGLIGETEPLDKEYWIEQIAILSSHGLRVLALLRGTLPKGSISEGQQLGPDFVQDRSGPWLTMVGLCAIMDPPRPECVDAVSIAHGAGVRVAMITGDHKDTALAIGCMLGLVDEQHSQAITGPEMDAMSDDEIKVAVQKYNVFARASPQNKIRIVKALQSQGEVCGMTGDGVNDAPALKAADMGVAMGKEGTDVAREAANMILADDNFATIVVAVREGRVVWDNLRKVLMVNTPINNAQGLSVLFGIICGLRNTTLTSIQVLYCNLICAVTLGFVTAVEPAEDGIMNMPPRRVGKRLIGRYLFLRIALGTLVLVLCTVWSVFLAEDLFLAEGMKYEEYLPFMRSQASNSLTFGAMSVTVSARFSYNSAFHPRIFRGNMSCWYAVAITAILQVAITYIPVVNEVIFDMGPMSAMQWLIVVVIMIIVFVIMELEKAFRRYMMSMGFDTNDTEYGVFDSAPTPNQDISLPKGASHLNLTELSK